MAWVWDDIVNTYLGDYRDKPLTVLDVGGPSGIQKCFKNVSWTYRSLNIKENADYDIGSSPYHWSSIQSNSFDVIVSTNTLEHIPFLWVTFHEIGRVLKNSGLAFLDVPSAGPEHPGNQLPGYRDKKYFDCWRVFSDGFSALCRYIEFSELEVFTSWGVDRMQYSFLIMQKPNLSEEQLSLYLQKNSFQKRAMGIDARAEFLEFQYDSDKNQSPIETKSGAGVLLESYRNAGISKSMDPYYYLKLGRCELLVGNYPAALAAFEAGITRLNSVQSPSYMSTAFDAALHTFYACSGEAKLRNGEPLSAIADFERCLALQPDFFEGHYHLIQAYQAIGDYQKALQCCEDFGRSHREHAQIAKEHVLRSWK